ncbi:MAG TPA: SIMPL domain-containing protein [Bryobacteraceae bacterium]|nr:SIMPL domain-containing protein [Bryobacteraceae bacterium]
MRAFCRLLWTLPFAASVLMAQVIGPIHTIQAVGNASISVNPDQAQLSVGVVTNATTAQDAAQQNATQTTAVVNAVKSVLGATGSVQTVGYSVMPRYSSAPGQTSVITGYTVNNTVQVTTSDLSLPGRLIDAANQAGANNISGLSFSLKDSDPVKQQALGQAAKQALAHANAIATGLGAKTGSILSAQEGATVQPLVLGAGPAAAQTPIETGTVSVTATVAVNVALTE